MKELILTRSDKPTKKYEISFYDAIGTHIKGVVRFGAKGYSDYTINKDDKKKENYIKRHSVNEDWSDLDKPGTWSRYILWNKPTIKESIKDMEKRFNIKIIDKT
jgi:hypothetical protein